MIDNNSKLSVKDRKKLKSNSDKIYYANFAFEDYLDNNLSQNNVEIKDVLKKIGNFWKLKQTTSGCEILNLSDDLVKEVEKIYDLLGRENFTFYSDGVVEYKWNG